MCFCLPDAADKKKQGNLSFPVFFWNNNFRLY